MSFFDYLEKLREKPEHERRRIAVVAVTIITGMVIIVWASSLSLQNPKPETSKAPGPLEVLGETFGEGIRSIKESVKSQFASSTIATSTEE